MAADLTLPSGLVIRGRALSDATTPCDFTLALARGPLPPWPHRRVRWPDFGLPLDPADALDAITETLRRARAGERVEVGCRGGVGRTGTALAALAILDGVPRREAVAYVRAGYHPKAVETPWQRGWLLRVPEGGS